MEKICDTHCQYNSYDIFCRSEVESIQTFSSLKCPECGFKNNNFQLFINEKRIEHFKENYARHWKARERTVNAMLTYYQHIWYIKIIFIKGYSSVMIGRNCLYKAKLNEHAKNVHGSNNQQCPYCSLTFTISPKLE